MKKLILILSLLLGVFVTEAKTRIKVEVHDYVSVDETFQVKFIIEGESDVSNFTWNCNDNNLEVLWGPSQARSSSTRSINGKTTSKTERFYIYTVMAKTSGVVTIPQASAVVDGETIYSKPEKITVVSSGASKPSSKSSPKSSSKSSSSTNPTQQQQQKKKEGESLIFRLVLDHSNIIIGEPITATLKLYTNVSVSYIDAVYPPTFQGFKVTEIPTSGNISFKRELLDGEIYQAANIASYRLYPQQQGKITIGPAEIICRINDRTYGFVRSRASTKERVVNVTGLPSGAPDSFGEGVGKFEVSARLSENELQTHEVGSLFITISGSGNVSYLQAPKVEFPSDFEVYDVKADLNLTGSGLSGSKTFEYPFIPRHHGDFVIGPIEYSFYDTGTGRYKTTTIPPLDVVVYKGTDQNAVATIPMQSSSQKDDVETLGNDIRFIELDDAGLSEKGSFFLFSNLFWIFTLIIVLAGLVVWIVLGRMTALRKDVVGAKKRAATRMAFKRLRNAETFLKQGIDSAFYEELHKAMLGYVSDKLNMPISELSHEKITDSLLSRGIDKSIVDSFEGLLDVCEYARYAPAAGNDAMASHYRSAAEVISSIDSNMKSVKKNHIKTDVALILLFLSVTVSAYGNTDSLWNAANNAYVDKQWDVAVENYEQISQKNLESPVLYYNLGNAYYKSGNVPKAILNYERCLRVDPSNEDAQYNLDFLNTQIRDKIESVPEFFLTIWFKNISLLLTSNSWAILFLVFLSITVALILLFIFPPRPVWRKVSFSVGIVTLLLSASTLAFSVHNKDLGTDTTTAIIMSPVVSAMGTPSEGESQELFILHEGTKVKVMDEVGDWNNIELADGRQGWVPSKDIEEI